MIDPHVHCRDGKQAYKETIKHVFEIAKNQGVEKIFDMPNTDPPIISDKNVQERLKLVPSDRKDDYFLYLGLSSDNHQLEKAVDCFDRFSEVVGFKLYAGKSVGSLSVIEEEKQRRIYKILSDLGYKGVVAVHCEKESYLKPRLWKPQNPISHSFVRSKDAEIKSISDQIRFSIEMKFKGILHIVHISCPESVELVEKARNQIKITCGVTPHHILWTSEMLKRPDGLLYKTNPPLRDKKDVMKLRKYLKEGKIDWIETDHAPHHIGEKLFYPYLSGFPSLYLYRDFVSKFLPAFGIKNTEIKKLTYNNIVRTFKSKLSK